MVTRRIPDPKIGGSIPSGVTEFLVCPVAVLAEWLRRMLKAHVRKSVGSIPTDCNFFLIGMSFPDPRGGPRGPPRAFCTLIIVFFPSLGQFLNLFFVLTQ